MFTGSTFQVGFSRESVSRLRTAFGSLATLEAEIVAGTPAAVALLAHEVAAAVEHEFRPHDRGPFRPGDDRHVRTIDTIRVTEAGMAAVVSMGGGSPYVEFGSAPHVIQAKNANALHWHVAGSHFFAHTVHHPGYRGDPFLERSIEDVRDVAILNAIVARTSIMRMVSEGL